MKLYDNGKTLLNAFLLDIVDSIYFYSVASLIYKDGIFEALMKYRGIPYLDHEGRQACYFGSD